MDYLKEGIGLRAMAQRDPLIEYQREGYQLFQAMTDAIKEEAVGYLFNLEVKVAEAPAQATASADEAPGSADGRPAAGGTAEPVLVAKGIDGPERQVPLQYSAPSVDGDSSTTVTRGRRAAGPATSTPTGASGAAGADADGTGAGEDAGNREARRKAAKQQRRRG
jgi:preprotein translocase subunit SecA